MLYILYSSLLFWECDICFIYFYCYYLGLIVLYWIVCRTIGLSWLSDYWAVGHPDCWVISLTPKQTQHPFQEVCQETQHSSGIINDEYRINVTQFRTTIHRYCRKINYCIFVSKSRNFKTTFISWQLASMSIS